MNKVDICGVHINKVTMKAALERVDDMVQHGGGYVVTPNPEIILKAQKDEEFMKVLNKAGLSIPDGVGVQVAGDFLVSQRSNNSLIRLMQYFKLLIARVLLRNQFEVFTERVTGSDLLRNIVETKKFKVFFLGTRQPVLDEAKQKVEKNGSAECVGVDEGGDINSGFNKVAERSVRVLKDSGADVVFVAYGAPYQEEIAVRICEQVDGVVAICVGGGIDFYAGEQIRAPHVMQVFYLEWLWRLIKEPRRLRRIYNAVFSFSHLLIRVN